MNKPVFISFLMFLFWLSQGVKAQENLVPNGSFEELSDCPIGADIEKAIGWFSPNQATPDLFNQCAPVSDNYSVPINGNGYQEAQDGFGYAGIVPYSFNVSQFMFREYLAIEMKTTLEDNQLYKVRFFINLTDDSPLAINKLGFGFLNQNVFFNDTEVIFPSKSETSPSFYYDTTLWIPFESVYKSNGEEKYLIIGNFFNDTDTDTIPISSNLSDVYYFIDNVSIEPILIPEINIITPNNDGLNDVAFLVSELKEYTVDILNRWGQKVNTFDFSTGWKGDDYNGKLLNDGVYFYIISTRGEKLKTGFIQLIR